MKKTKRLQDFEGHKITGPTNCTEAHGKSKKPDGRGLGLSINPRRKFAETPKEYKELLIECLGNELRERGFEDKKKALILGIAGKLITEKNYIEWINLTSKEIYTKVENFIIENL